MCRPPVPAGRGKARPPAILVHGIADARDALAAARRHAAAVTLLSPASAAQAQGVGWWQALVRHVSAEYPDVSFAALLDCGARADLAQAALRQGMGRDPASGLVFRGAAAVARRLAEIAARQHASIARRRPHALDLLGVSDRDAALDAWLSKSGPIRGAG